MPRAAQSRTKTTETPIAVGTGAAAGGAAAAGAAAGAAGAGAATFIHRVDLGAELDHRPASSPTTRTSG